MVAQVRVGRRIIRIKILVIERKKTSFFCQKFDKMFLGSVTKFERTRMMSSSFNYYLKNFFWSLLIIHSYS